MASLEHFYYGQLVHHGQPTGDPRVLAKSGGITDEFVTAALRSAMIPPLAVGQGIAWAILREEREVYCIMTQAQTGAAGQVTRHFAQIPLDVMRALSGNLRQVFPFVQMEVPVFEMLGDRLQPFTIDNPGTPPTDQAVDSLLDLMTYTGNKTANIEPLLAAVVRNVPLMVRNAPTTIEERMQFIQGLLMLLPSSTRFNTTFATHVNNLVDLRARIQFYDGPPPENTVAFDWTTKAITGAEVKDEYARFILSQLRLDAELVTQETERLTPTAGWRFRTGSSLADALAYASNRSRIDRSVTTGQPVEVAEVSRILAEDPTLGDDLRAAYVRHVMNFSLALDDLQHTDPVAVAVHHTPQLGEEVHRLLVGALKDGKGTQVAEMLQRWMSNPLSPEGPQWLALLHQASLIELDQYIAGKDYEGIQQWLRSFETQGSAFGGDKLARPALEKIIPIVGDDPRLPTQVMLFAMTYLEKKDAQRIIALPSFAQALPQPVKRFIFTLTSTEPTPEHVLTEAATSVGEAGQDKATLLFADMAHNAGKYSLIDTPTLERLARVASTPLGVKYRDSLLAIARAAHDSFVDKLPAPGPRAVLQLMLLSERYDMLARGMINFARDVYGVERQTEYVRMLHEVFALTPLDPAQAAPVLTAMELADVLGIPLMAVQSGLLEGTKWSPDLRSIADKLLTEVLAHPDYWELMPPEITYNLVRYYFERGDDDKLRQAGYVAATNAAIQSEDRPGLQTVSNSYKLMRNDKERQKIAFDIIRQYARLAPEKPAQRALTYYTKELGDEAGGRLNIAYNLSGFMGRVAFDIYLEALHQTADLLNTLVDTYTKKAEKPSLKKLQASFDPFRLKLEEGMRRALAEDFKRLGLALINLNKQNDTRSGLFTRQLDSLLKGQSAPRSSMDVWKVMGGHISRGRALPLKLTPAVGVNTPWGALGNSPLLLTQHVASAADVLESALNTPPNKWTGAQISAELDSLQSQLTGGDGLREKLRQAAIDFQRLPDLVKMLVDEGDASAIDPNSRLGKRLDTAQQEPRNGLESLRFYAGNLERL